MGKWATNPTPNIIKRREQASVKRAANRDGINTYQREWRQRNLESTRDYHRVYQAEWKAANPARRQIYTEKARLHYYTLDDSYKRGRRLTRYGLSLAEYDVMLALQGGVCAICGGLSTHNRRLAVDHCHKTQKIRQLLCDACNKGLGHFKDDPDLMNKAANYLEKYKIGEAA